MISILQTGIFSHLFSQYAVMIIHTEHLNQPHNFETTTTEQATLWTKSEKELHVQGG